VLGTIPDLLRLVAVPVLGWAAWRDVRTRRVSNRTWIPLVLVAAVALALDAHAALERGNDAFFVRVAISLGFVVPLAYAFWRLGGFGGADAKAFMVIAALFPTFPTYYLDAVAIPLQPSAIGVFSLTILSNTVLVGLAYPLAVAAGNLLGGDVSPAMLVGRPVRVEAIPETHGRLLETPQGTTLSGLDLDALRMYLAWREERLAAVRAEPDAYRDPASLPEEPASPGDGAVATDGGEPPEPAGEHRGGAPDGAAEDHPADPWGARAFLADIDHDAYGTDPDTLRKGLDLLVTADRVWVSPGIPFLVPTFVGLLVALTYGDVLYVALQSLGVGP
jgi:preflagellin peptidase FlaK